MGYSCLLSADAKRGQRAGAERRAEVLPGSSSKKTSETKARVGSVVEGLKGATLLLLRCRPSKTDAARAKCARSRTVPFHNLS